MFRASKVKVNVAEITSDKAQPTTPIDKTFPSTNEINRTISIESDGKASINSAKDRRISVDVTYWIPSNTEKVILRKTWSDDFDFLYNLGAKIYIYIFENEPEAKKLFPKIHQHGEKFKESEEFRSQALKFVQVIGLVKKYHNSEDVSLVEFNKAAVKI
uniref:Globin family profile domain-containing protein n=1 Tax=Acrobeloides nanus TaxID=290746 RepID=A0A914C7N9_9BILA